MAHIRQEFAFCLVGGFGGIFLALRIRIQPCIADGIRRAVQNLEPAKVGWGAGKVENQVHNRRWRM